MDREDWVTIGVVFGVTCLMLFSVSMCSHEVTQNEYRVQAVEHGYAHWEVSPDGSVTFAWNDEAAGETVKECLCSGCK